jgi:hypothetical protein
MGEEFWSATRVAGVLLVSSALIPIGGGLVLALATGYRPVIGGSQQDLERIASQVTTHRWALSFWVVGYFAALLGFGILTSQLQESGGRTIASLALAGYVITFIFVALEATFHMSVTIWAALETIRDSAVPNFYEPFRQWLSVYGQYIYSIIGLLAIAGYGWALLRTGLIPDWVGWLSIGWSGLWIVAFLALRTTLPGTLLIMPLVIGIALLFSSRAS